MGELYSYIAPSKDGFWEVDLQEGIITTIPDKEGNRTTLFYLDHFAWLSQLLNPQILPLFSTVVLAYIATHKRAIELLGTINESYKEEDGSRILSGAIGDFISTHSSQLPVSYQSGEARSRILRVLLENPHNGLKLKQSKRLIDQLQTWQANTPFQISTGSLSARRGIYSFAVHCGKISNKENLIARADRLPSIPEFHLLEAPSGRDVVAEVEDATEDLLSQLSVDPRTQKIAWLMPLVQAGLRIPLATLAEAAQRAGGVSDVSNRGPLSTLLLTEHANDPDIFALRVGSGQALYIEREPPPQPDEEPPIMAIDTTLTTWGTPRLIAYAAAFAMQQKSKNNLRAVLLKEELTEAQLSTKADWLAALGHRSSKLNPTHALKQILTEAADSAVPIAIATTPEVVESVSTREALRNHPTVSVLLIAIQASGEVQLILANGTQRRTVGRFSIDVQGEIEKQKAKAPNRSTHKEEPTNKGYGEAICPLRPPAKRKQYFSILASESEENKNEIRESLKYQRQEYKLNSENRVKLKMASTFDIMCERMVRLSCVPIYIVRDTRGKLATLGVSSEKEFIWLTIDSREPVRIPLATSWDAESALNLIEQDEDNTINFYKSPPDLSDITPEIGENLWIPSIRFHKEKKDIKLEHKSVNSLLSSNQAPDGIKSIKHIDLNDDGQTAPLAINGHFINWSNDSNDGSYLRLDRSILSKKYLKRVYIPSSFKRKSFEFRDTYTNSIYKYEYVSQGLIAFRCLKDDGMTVFMRLQFNDGICMATRDHWTGYDRLLPDINPRYIEPHAFLLRYINPLIEALKKTV
ncbi:MAG: hypothetical protein AB8F78_09235 [Saprospiraceae bacterium]